MNRRSFLKLALSMIAVVAVAPRTLLAEDPKISKYINPTTSSDRINMRHMALKIQQALEYHRFELNDSITRQKIVNETFALLEDYRRRRVLYQYKVVCDETNNSPKVIDHNTLVLDVWIQPKREIKFSQITCHIGPGRSFPIIKS